MPGPGEKGADARLYGLWVGQVVRRDDPSGLGRIKWTVPGLVEPASPWAIPIGMVAQKEEGAWDIPAKGENVACGLLGGDPKKPYWIAGPWAAGEAPFNSVEKKGLRFFDFVVQFEDDAATLEDLDTGMKVELKRSTQKVSIYAAAAIDIESLGLVRILATGCEIMGRPVVPGKEPIR